MHVVLEAIAAQITKDLKDRAFSDTVRGVYVNELERRERQFFHETSCLPALVRVVEFTSTIEVFIRSPWASRAANRCRIRVDDRSGEARTGEYGVKCSQRGHSRYCNGAALLAGLVWRGMKEATKAEAPAGPTEAEIQDACRRLEAELTQNADKITAILRDAE